MKSALESRANPEWSSGLKISLSLHFGIVALVLIVPHLFPGAPIVPALPSLKVDLVALPDRQKSESVPESKPAATPEPTPATKPVEAPPAPAVHHEEAIPLKAAKPKIPAKPVQEPPSAAKRASNALSRLRALEAVRSSEVPAAPAKGNQLSKGTATSGEARENSNSAYYADVVEQVRTRWALPPWLARRKDLAAQVQIFVDARGNVIRMELVKSSGHPVFDEHMQAAVRDSQPFPPPPEEVRTSVRHFGMVLAFPI